MQPVTKTCNKMLLFSKVKLVTIITNLSTSVPISYPITLDLLIMSMHIPGLFQYLPTSLYGLRPRIDQGHKEYSNQRMSS